MTNQKSPAPPSPETAKPLAVTRPGAFTRFWQQVSLTKITIFIISLFFFILAITLMKEGARDLGPVVRDSIKVENAANSLGFGWLFSYAVMSGSPVAAAALTFFDGGVIDQLGAFAMITGSRLGASFIVLFIGFIYVWRGRNKANSLSMGLLSLSVTGSTHFVGLFAGVWLLNTGLLDPFQLQSGAMLNALTDYIFDPIVAFSLSILPRWALFVVGLLVIMVSFSLFDRCLPEMSLKESHVGAVSRLVYRPWVMFLLGGSITMVSMSVSISLSILVPLSNRGFVRRENVIPYIMGANITPFIDTLLAAVLLNNQMAFTVVMVEMVSIALVSMIILATSYYRFERAMLNFVTWLVAENVRLAIFMVLIFAVPILLLFV